MVRGQAALLLVIGALLVSACGFHLRGSVSAALPFDTLHIRDRANDGMLTSQLKTALSRSDVSMVDDPDQADVVLTLRQVRSEQRVLTISPSGNVEEYAVYYTVDFTLWDKQEAGPGLVQTIELQRDYTYDEDQVLETGQEKDRLVRAMRTDAVRNLLQRMQAMNRDSQSNVIEQEESENVPGLQEQSRP
jgi:LPS-assembly lipoprotein